MPIHSAANKSRRGHIGIDDLYLCRLKSLKEITWYLDTRHELVHGNKYEQSYGMGFRLNQTLTELTVFVKFQLLDEASKTIRIEYTIAAEYEIDHKLQIAKITRGKQDTARILRPDIYAHLLMETVAGLQGIHSVRSQGTRYVDFSFMRLKHSDVVKHLEDQELVMQS